MPITVPTELTGDQRMEVDRLSRRWFLRPFMSYGDYRGYTFLLAGIVGVALAVFDPETYRGREYWLASVACATFGGVVLLIAHHGRRSRFRKVLNGIQQGPGSASFEDEGIEYRTSSVTMLPWRAFQSAVVGDRVVLLFLAGRTNKFYILPLPNEVDEERQSLIGLLRRMLGHGKVQDASSRRSRI